MPSGGDDKGGLSTTRVCQGGLFFILSLDQQAFSFKKKALERILGLGLGEGNTGRYRKERQRLLVFMGDLQRDNYKNNKSSEAKTTHILAGGVQVGT
jgi:hypothetical protein